MSTHEYDAVVVGGGVSGIIACLKLNSRGFKTALISRGDPACCLSTGCIDVFSRTDSPLDGIRGLPPEHPYSLVGRKGVADALSYFLTVMDEAGLPYEGSPGKTGGSSPRSEIRKPPASCRRPWPMPTYPAASTFR